MKKLTLVFLLALVLPNAHAVDTEVRVLAVYFETQTNPLATLTSLNEMFNAWDSSGPNPTTLKIVNANFPVAIPGFQVDPDPVRFVNMLVLSARIRDLRDQFAADAVLVYIGEPPPVPPLSQDSPCGLTSAGPPGHWVDTIANGVVIEEASFDSTNSPIPNLDLRGSESGHLAYIAVAGACDADKDITATHEFGHIFGGGHVLNTVAGNDTWLMPSSHAFGNSIVTPAGTFCSFSAMASPNDISKVCPASVLPPGQSNSYSVSNPIQPNADNQGTINFTRRSVANYRQGTSGDGGPPVTECNDGNDNDGDGMVDLMDADCEGPIGVEQGSAGPPNPPVSGNGCFVQPPVLVSSSLVGGQCNPIPYSRYAITWQPGAACIPDFYEVYQSFPIGTPYRFFSTETTPNAEGIITGAQPVDNARVRVRACVTGGGCTSLSTSNTVVSPQC